MIIYVVCSRLGTPLIAFQDMAQANQYVLMQEGRYLKFSIVEIELESYKM